MRHWGQALKEQTTQTLQQNRKTLLAFAIPAALLLLAYLVRGIFPIGDRSVLTIDLFHQYAPFLADLRRKLLGVESLMYAWNGGLGTNFLALYAYYLASPLNVFIVFFPESFLTEAVLFLIVFKTGLSGAFFFLYLRGVWAREDNLMVALSAFYALSAYALAFSWNIMWLDSLYLLPLLMLGLHRLIRQGRCLLYIIALTLILLVNYYIAFFVALFTLLYFPVCLFSQLGLTPASRWLKATGRFAACSLWAGGMASILLLPTFASLQLTSAADDAFPQTLTHYYEFFDYIGQHFVLTEPTIRSGMPNMYSGVIVLLLVPMFFLSRSFSLRSKFLHLALFLILILSFNLNWLNFIWHGLHFPNQLPYRNSFVYIFLVLSLAYPALAAIKEFRGKFIGALAGLIAVLALLTQKVHDDPPSEASILLTIVFVVLYAGILSMRRMRRRHHDDWSLILVFALIAELLISTVLTVHTIDQNEHYSNRDGYLAGVEASEVRETVRRLHQEHPPEDFFRMESFPPKTTNDPFLYGYRGLSIFSSTMPTLPVQTFQNLGYHSNGINSYKYEGSTIVLDSLFGLRYLLHRSEPVIDENLRTLWLSTRQVDVYKNQHALPLGFMATSELEHWTSAGSNPYQAQNDLISALTGDDRDVFRRLTIGEGMHENLTLSLGGQGNIHFNRDNEAASSHARLLIEPDQTQRIGLHLEVAPNQPEQGYVLLGESTQLDFNARRSTLVDLGQLEAETSAEFNLRFADSAPSSGNFELHAYALEEDVFLEAMETLSQQALDLSRMQNTRVEGTVTANEEGLLFLSMPFDAGWRFWVGEESVQPVVIDEGLMALPLSQGTHQIRMRYRTPYALPGALISGAFTLLLIGGLVLKKKMKKKVLARPAPPLILPDEEASPQEQGSQTTEDDDA